MLIQHIFRAIKALLNENIVKYCNNQRVCTKYSREHFTFNSFFTWEHFYIEFSLKHQDHCTICVLCTMCYLWWLQLVFLMSKGCSKIIIKMHHLELLHFSEVFTFVVNLSNTCRCLMMLKSSQCERYLLNFVV